MLSASRIWSHRDQVLMELLWTDTQVQRSRYAVPDHEHNNIRYHWIIAEQDCGRELSSSYFHAFATDSSRSLTSLTALLTVPSTRPPALSRRLTPVFSFLAASIILVLLLLVNTRHSAPSQAIPTLWLPHPSRARRSGRRAPHCRCRSRRA